MKILTLVSWSKVLAVVLAVAAIIGWWMFVASMTTVIPVVGQP